MTDAVLPVTAGLFSRLFTGRSEGRGKEMKGKSDSGMTGRNEIQENLKEWLENPHWAEYYSSAPAGRCREFIALEFFFRETEDKEAGEEMDRIENEMDAAELRHLLKWCGNASRS